VAPSHEPVQLPAIIQWIDGGMVDFVQVGYCIFCRNRD
jgi:hypothetical protein